jgi:Rrf2 family protein
MIINKTTEYAVSVLAFMAIRDQKLYASGSLHKALKIPSQYLKRLLTDLSKKGFIISTRGRNGGFMFARDLKQINFAQIIEAFEGTESMNTCLLGFTACIVDRPCVMHDIWTDARSKMSETLTNTTLADLKEKYIKDSVDINLKGILKQF